MEEEDLLARGIEYMSKEKNEFKQKMKQVRERQRQIDLLKQYDQF